MNEVLFVGHALLVAVATLGALRLGKSALVGLIALLAVLANLFVLKQTVLFGLHVTCSDVYIIGSMLGVTLLQEYYGKKAAKRAIWTAFFAMLLFGITSQIQLLYYPSPFDETHGAYGALMTPAPRIVFASFAAYLASQLLDRELFGRLKRGSLAWRASLSLTICQLVDTSLFAILGLWGLVHSIGQIILMSFAIKMIIIALTTPLTQLTHRLVPRHDHPL